MADAGVGEANGVEHAAETGALVLPCWVGARLI